MSRRAKRSPKRACEVHLRDLEKFEKPPATVELVSRIAVTAPIAPPPATSGCSSSASW